MAAWEQSLQELVRTRGTALVGYAYLLCGDRREAEDLVQDALVKTYARGVPQPDVPHPGALRGRGVRAAVPAAGRHWDPGRAVGLLPAGRRLLGAARLPGHVACGASQRAGRARSRGARRTRGRCPDRVPARRRPGDV